MHRRLVEPVLVALAANRAGYFNRLVDSVEQDARIQVMPNLVFLVLKETIPYLPTNLKEDDLQDMLFEFVALNKERLTRIIHDRRFIENPKILAEVTKEFVLQALSTTLEDHELGKIRDLREREKSTYRFSYPDGIESDFPYRADDD